MAGDRSAFAFLVRVEAWNLKMKVEFFRQPVTRQRIRSRELCAGVGGVAVEFDVDEGAHARNGAGADIGPCRYLKNRTSGVGERMARYSRQTPRAGRLPIVVDPVLEQHVGNVGAALDPVDMWLQRGPDFPAMGHLRDDTDLIQIVIAGSGMITGGRVLTYLGQLIDRSDTTVLLVGFMAEGTRGRQLSEGASQIRFFGREFPVKARIVQLRSLSAHADKSELLDWSADIRNFPEGVFLIHGEPEASASLQQTLEQDRRWPVHIPYLGEKRILWHLNGQN